MFSVVLLRGSTKILARVNSILILATVPFLQSRSQQALRGRGVTAVAQPSCSCTVDVSLKLTENLGPHGRAFVYEDSNYW